MERARRVEVRRAVPDDADPGLLPRVRVLRAGRHRGGLPAPLSTLDRSLLATPTDVAARSLLGARLVRDDSTGRRAGRIVEVEAYGGGHDRASHARFGETARNRVMFGLPGLAYVYLVYGMYDCLNVVTGPEGEPSAVLIRAVEPLEGVDAMRTERLATSASRRRSMTPERVAAERSRLAALPVHRLARGPGLVAAAFGLTTAWTGTDLCDAASPVRLEPAPNDEPPTEIVATPRIGIAYAGEPWQSALWRFVARGSRSVSGPNARR